jgi:hypothetical protein
VVRDIDDRCGGGATGACDLREREAAPEYLLFSGWASRGGKDEVDQGREEVLFRDTGPKECANEYVREFDDRRGS